MDVFVFVRFPYSVCICVFAIKTLYLHGKTINRADYEVSYRHTEFDKLREDGWDLNNLKDISMSPAKVNGQIKEEAIIIITLMTDLG